MSEFITGGFALNQAWFQTKFPALNLAFFGSKPGGSVQNRVCILLQPGLGRSFALSGVPWFYPKCFRPNTSILIYPKCCCPKPGILIYPRKLGVSIKDSTWDTSDSFWV